MDEMKLYRTRENNVINLDDISLVYKDPETELYRVSFKNGLTFEFPELDEEDIKNFIEYNNYFIK